MRTVIWFSCGAASAVAAYLATRKDHKAVLVYCDTGSEHPDNKRFLKDVEDWLGTKVTVLKSDRYIDHFDVIRKTKYINGTAGARCTVELKKQLRFKFQKPDDIQVFGYTCEERNRADRLIKAYPEINAEFPLIHSMWSKSACLGFIERQGIKLPEMYRLGFNNNNCIGCVKGGAGYWNLVRKCFPEKFNQMAKLERAIGHSCLKNKYLDELSEHEGKHKEPEMFCDFVCLSQDAEGWR